MVRLEDLARDVHALTIAAGMARAMGGEVLMPDWESSKATFDADLAAEPRDRDDPVADSRPQTGRGIEMRALGMSGD